MALLHLSLIIPCLLESLVIKYIKALWTKYKFFYFSKGNLMVMVVCHIKMEIFLLVNFWMEWQKGLLFILTQMVLIMKEKCHKIKQMIKMQFLNQKVSHIKDQLSITNLMEKASKLAISILFKANTSKAKDLKER